jgi:hypothetical protein
MQVLGSFSLERMSDATAKLERAKIVQAALYASNLVGPHAG